MDICVDVDDTLLNTTGFNYENPVPIKKNIDRVNKLYDRGEYIIIWTSRGVGTKRDMYKFTYDQLIQAGVKFHELHTDKRIFDVLIDDRSANWTKTIDLGV